MCTCVSVCALNDLEGCDGNALSGDSGRVMFLANVRCQTQVQENRHLCPTSSAPRAVQPFDFVVAGETATLSDAAQVEPHR